MTSILLLSLFVLIVVGAGTVVYAVKHAEDGLEDESGFHFTGPRARRDASVQVKYVPQSSARTFPAGLPTA